MYMHTHTHTHTHTYVPQHTLWRYTHCRQVESSETTSPRPGAAQGSPIFSGQKFYARASSPGFLMRPQSPAIARVPSPAPGSRNISPTLAMKNTLSPRSLKSIHSPLGGISAAHSPRAHSPRTSATHSPRASGAQSQHRPAQSFSSGGHTPGRATPSSLPGLPPTTPRSGAVYVNGPYSKPKRPASPQGTKRSLFMPMPDHTNSLTASVKYSQASFAGNEPAINSKVAAWLSSHSSQDQEEEAPPIFLEV